MHRIDNSKYVLFIEPDINKKASKPIHDKFFFKMENLLNTVPTGTSGYSDLTCNGAFFQGGYYRGFHNIGDGGPSSSRESLLPGGYITNASAAHYLAYYRNQIPKSEMEKVKRALGFQDKMEVGDFVWINSDTPELVEITEIEGDTYHLLSFEGARYFRKWGGLSLEKPETQVRLVEDHPSFMSK